MTAIHCVAGAVPDEPLDVVLAAVLSAPLPDIRTDDCAPADGLVLGAFLRPHLHGLHPFLVESDLAAAVDVLQVLPDGATVLRFHRRNSTTEVLAEYQSCLVVVRSWTRTADVWVSGADREQVERLVAHVRATVPTAPRERAVRVTFWQLGRYRSRRSRDIEVPSGADVAPLYPSAVREAMNRLAGFRPEPGAASGRLLLWHGPPGTGKTTAVRALFDAWRGWASAHVVSDVERLLDAGDYMARVLLDQDEDEDDGGSWRLVVIEDADQLLRRDAQARVGGSLGRLLNTADGLLGQGCRAMVLLTTNEPIAEMHPALLRPGRCLARIEFPAFEAGEASRLVGERVDRPLTLAEIMERRGRLTRVQSVAEPVRIGNYL